MPLKHLLTGLFLKKLSQIVCIYAKSTHYFMNVSQYIINKYIFLKLKKKFIYYTHNSIFINFEHVYLRHLFTISYCKISYIYIYIYIFCYVNIFNLIYINLLNLNSLITILKKVLEPSWLTLNLPFHLNMSPPLANSSHSFIWGLRFCNFLLRSRKPCFFIESYFIYSLLYESISMKS